MPTYPYLAPRKIATTVTSSATLAKGRHTPVDATSGAATLTLPTDAAAGVELSVEKVDASGNAVTVSGTLRGVASSTIALTTQYEARTFLSEGAGSWRPLSDHRTAASLSAMFAVVLSPGLSNGTDDTTAIQTVLTAARVAGGGRVRGIPGQTYRISASLLIGSNTELDMTGCTVMSVNQNVAAGAGFNLLRNYALNNPAATATDAAITSGSNVVTTSLGASAVVGQSVTVDGAAATGTQAICGKVSAATATTITVVDHFGNPVNAMTTVSAATVRLFTRDINVRLVGGTWYKNGIGGQGTGIGTHALYLRHIDGLHLAGQRYQSNCGKYAVSVAAITDYVIERQTGLNTYSDGIHIDGPAFNGVVRDVFGKYGDDMVAITPMDWHQFGDVCGDVTDLAIENIYPTATIRAAVKILGGAQGAARNIRIRNVGGTSVTNDSAVWIGNDQTQPETIGGWIDEVYIENLTTDVPADVGKFRINATSIGAIHIKGVPLSSGSGVSQLLAVAPEVAGATIESLTVEDVDIRNVGVGKWVLNVNGFSHVKKLVLKNWQSSTTNGFTACAISGGTVDELHFDGFMGTQQPDASGNGGLVYLTNAAANVGRLTMTNLHVTGNNTGAPIHAPVAGATLTKVVMSTSTLSGYAWLFALATTTEVQFNGVISTSPGQGCGFVYATGNATVNGAGNSLAAGSANWQLSAGGKIAVRAIDAPASTHAGCIPTIAAGAGAGTSPTVAVAGTDRTGTITITPGTSPAAGVQGTVTFIGTWPATPKVALTATNAAAQAAGLYVSSKSATTFAVSSAGVPSGAMTFDYSILG